LVRWLVLRRKLAEFNVGAFRRHVYQLSKQ